MKASYARHIQIQTFNVTAFFSLMEGACWAVCSVTRDRFPELKWA